MRNNRVKEEEQLSQLSLKPANLFSLEERRITNKWPEWYVRDDDMIFRLMSVLANTTLAPAGKSELYRINSLEESIKVVRNYQDSNEDITARFAVMVNNLCMDPVIVEQILAKHPLPPKFDDDGRYIAEFDDEPEEKKEVLLDPSNKKPDTKTEEDEDKEEDKREWGLIPTMTRLLLWYMNSTNVLSYLVNVFSTLA